MVLRHHQIGYHPTRFAHVELMRPAVQLGEFVPTIPPAADLPADRFRHSWMISQRPHQSLLVQQVLLKDSIARRIVAIGPLVTHADVVSREAWLLFVSVLRLGIN